MYDFINDEFDLMIDQKSYFGNIIMIYGVEKMYKYIFEYCLYSPDALWKSAVVNFY